MLITRRSILSLLALLLVTTPAFAGDFVERIRQAHGADTWHGRSALAANIVVEFGGNKMIQGRMITDTPVGKTRFELVNGTVLVFDGQDAWTSPGDSKFAGTRFHVLTWPYFVAAAMKLDDPGSHMEELGEQPYRDGRSLPAGRLTFDSGVGDSPDDWYIVYASPNNQLTAMAYIVTFGKDAAEAEKEPHAIVYDGYETLDGVTLSTQWSFYNWSAEGGISGEPIGSVSLTDLSFVETDADTFAVPAGARKEAAPGS